jgi:hypothetical protein
MSNGTGLADRIAAQLAALSTQQALQVLTEVQQRILKASVTRDDEGLSRPWAPCPVAIRSPVGGVSKIESDPEILAFITGLTEYQSLKKIVDLCIRKFGLERSPSKSSVHRYLQKISKLHEEKS